MGLLKSACAEADSESPASSGLRPRGIKAAGMPNIAPELADKYANKHSLFRQRTGSQYKYLRHWSFVAANHIAKRVASQPILAANKIPSPAASANRSLVGSKAIALMPSEVKLTTLIGDDQALEYIKTGVLHDLLQYPNPVQSRYEMTYSAVMSLLMTGEAYFVHDIDKKTKLPQVWALPSHYIVPQHAGGLFTGYILRSEDTEKGVPIAPENVQRVYFPDPSDIKSCISPLMTQLEAIIVDGYVQNSQRNAFANGIFPGVMIKVGRIGGKDKAPRRALQAHQRRQLFESARRIWGGVGRTGEPLIVDALIEDVKPFTMSPREMDWNTSAAAVKDRIFQALSLNPIVTGQVTGANRAQAIVAEQAQVLNVLNPILTQLSMGLGPFFLYVTDSPDNVVVWYELCRAEDDELTQRDWRDASEFGAVTINEIRGNRLGLDPTPWGEMAANSSKLLQPMVNLLASVGKGETDPGAAAMVLSRFLAIDVSDIAAVLNKGDGAIKRLQDRLTDFKGHIEAKSDSELGAYFKKQLEDVSKSVSDHQES